jgi:hypothetical protein
VNIMQERTWEILGKPAMIPSLGRIGMFMIQVDIGGHPPIPLGPTPLFLSVFQFP